MSAFTGKCFVLYAGREQSGDAAGLESAAFLATGAARQGSANRRRAKALVLLLRNSGLRISGAVTLSADRLDGDKLFLYTSKDGTPVYCPLPPFVVMAVQATIEPNGRLYFWSGNGKVKTITSDWQAKLKTLFDLAKVPTGHAHRFRDTFATELLLAGVPLERDVRSTWAPSETAAEGTPEVRGGGPRPN